MNRALLVGINKYPEAPLRGCVNDITDMANFLVEHCGFASREVRLLADGRATTPAILSRLAWLVRGAKPGDRLLFHYSGHGTQVATRNAAEEIDGELARATEGLNVTLISGCRSNQTSADAWFNGRANGALTYYLLRALEKPDGLRQPLSEIVTAMRSTLKRDGYKQQPQIEGSKEVAKRAFLNAR